jgi:hypothetical protein
MDNKNVWVAFLFSAILGAGVWVSISLLTGQREAWDSAYYFLYGLPLTALVTGLLGFIAPIRAWRWGVVAMTSQALIAVLQNPMANLLPLGLIVFAILSLPCILTAYLGAFIRRKITRA